MKPITRARSLVRVTVNGVTWKIRLTPKNLEIRKHYGRKKNALTVPLMDVIEFACGQKLMKI